MSKSIPEISDIPPEILRKQFEELIILTIKEMTNTIRNLEDRIEVLEKGGK